MRFWESSEAHLSIYEALVKVCSLVEPYLNDAFAASSLASLDIKLRYVPIIMTKDAHDKYTDRTKIRIKQRISDVAPQLDYELFVSGTLAEQLEEYLRGITHARPHLPRFGATPEQIADFDSILAGAKAALLRKQLH
jgi:hypothetical protein